MANEYTVDLPPEAERDKAFIAGWNAENFGDNPYDKKEAILARVFVDGLATRIIVKRLGLV